MLSQVVRSFVTWFLFAIFLAAVLGDQSPSVRLIDGDEVEPHKYPFMVAVRTFIGGTPVLCGGSLIKENIVLTAATCVNEVSESNKGEVILGAHNLDANDENQISMEFTDSDVDKHEEYDPTSKQNDLAVITLPSAVTLSDNISLTDIVGLFDISNTYADQLGVVLGWGKVNDTDTEFSNVLRKIEVTIISTLTCNIAYLFSLNDDQMCTTGVFKKNICLGDAGSPLIVNNTQVGIASYGSDFGCATGFPGVYTRLTSYMGWIYEKLDTYSNDA